MEIKEKDGRWLGKKNKKAKTWEDITDIIKFDGEFASVMGKAGRTNFHAYLGQSKGRWLEMYGVTSLLGFWGEKEKLLQWAVDRAVTEIKEAIGESTLSSEFTEIDGQWLEQTIEKARSAHKRSLEDAGTHGTDVHALVEEYINNRIKGEDAFPVELGTPLAEFIQWHKESGAKFLASELPLRSQYLWCAGTADFICEIDGKTYMGDVKTSNYVSYKHFIQCGAYALMYEEMGKGKIDGIIIAHLPRTGGFNLHVDMDVESYKDDFKALVRMVKRDKNKSYQLYNG